MRRKDICLYLSPSNRTRLEGLIRDRNTPTKIVWRAKIILATAQGLGTMAIMRYAQVTKRVVWRWQERFVEAGIDGLLKDKTRPSRIAPLDADKRLEVINKTAGETPPDQTHWSRASMAKAVGISPSSVGRIWKEAELKPHLVKTFKV